jgi:hypothetical protein
MSKNYRIDLGGEDRHNFTLGFGRIFTAIHGHILPEDHPFVKIYPTLVREVRNTILNEDPIAPASTTLEEEVQTVEEVLGVETPEKLVRQTRREKRK